MPEKLDACVADFMSNDANVKKWPDTDKRRQAAFAICNASIKQQEHRGYVIALDEVDKPEGDEPTWVHVLPLGEYEHPVFGILDITKEKVKNYVKNFRAKVRGQMLDIDYDHKDDVAKGGKAAGWIVSLEERLDGLWALVSWTGEALKEIKDGAWKYMSAEFLDHWRNNQGEVFDDVLLGAAITNRPFMKNLTPINLMEFDGELFALPEDKFPKEESGYRMATDSMYRCCNCVFYRMGDSDDGMGSCLVVEGDISGDYTSHFFQAIRNDVLMFNEERADNFYRRLFIDDELPFTSVQERLLELAGEV